MAISSAPHRVVLVVPDLQRKGTAKQACLLARGLRASRAEQVEVQVVALDRGGPFEGDLHEAGVPYTIVGRRWSIDPLAAVRLRGQLQRLAPALVHSWGPVAGVYGRAAIGNCVHVYSPGRIDAVPSAAANWSEHRLAPRTSRYVASCTALRDGAIAQGFPADRWSIIASGIEPTRSVKVSRAEFLASHQLPLDAQLVGFAGSLVHRHHVQQLVWAFDLIRVLRPNARFLILGDGPLRNELHRYADRASSLEHVRFLGERDDVSAILSYLDVYWQGSESSSYACSLLEAMATGVPVVASDIAAHRLLITEGETGFLIPLDDRAARARVTEQLLADAMLARRIGNAGREHALRENRAEKMVESFATHYSELLALRR